MGPARTIGGWMAAFATPEEVCDAARRVREAGYSRVDAYTPFPVDGLAAALGRDHTRLPLAVFAGGALGATTGFFMQWWANLYDYPLDVGGRPHNSWPSFIPITFELGVLGAALTAFFALLAANRLPRLHHPVFGAPGFPRASRDRFFLCVFADDPRFDVKSTRALLDGLDPESVVEVPR